MNTRPELLTSEFRALSARLGNDPLQVQGPGGNTSIKDGDVMWIKASGTELANALTQDIFVAVDRNGAKAEAGGAGDGTCKATVIDPAITLRPSIETTFHAALDHAVIAHTHSVATLVHVISPQGRAAVADKLVGLEFAMVPYAKPGLPLTAQILAAVKPSTQVILLQNHGLICCGSSVHDVSELIKDVERRLAMPTHRANGDRPQQVAPEGFEWTAESWMAKDEDINALALAGSYYPDHVVFLGSGLPAKDHEAHPPAVLFGGVGAALRLDATPSQRAMLTCISDVLSRLPNDWTAEPIGEMAEAELLNWDAEKYRQALAART
jgi:rhamnose utilization protein RhaD (predicted bifunctional aldolase and dehydrogenase)